MFFYFSLSFSPFIFPSLCIQICLNSQLSTIFRFLFFSSYSDSSHHPQIPHKISLSSLFIFCFSHSHFSVYNHCCFLCSLSVVFAFLVFVQAQWVVINFWFVNLLAISGCQNFSNLKEKDKLQWTCIC